MSARPEIPADEAVNIEINGQPCQARKGAMIIEVTDELGISVPRFCYHKKLSIAANCRMCMVEVEKVPPTAACAWSRWRRCRSRYRPAPPRLPKA
jgi:NADH-quinone oxidoreductase subunit G